VVTPRVASLLPSATEMVAALDLTALLVGRSHECDHPPSVASLPVLTSSALDAHLTGAALHAAVADRVRRALALFAVDEAMLAALAPDVILTQTLCAVCAVGPEDVASYVQTVRPGARLVALDGVDLASVFDDLRRVADACGQPARAAPVIAALQARLDALARAVGGAPRPRVACLEWLAPLMTAGNWGPELAAIAGGEAVLARAGVHSGTIALAALAAADPDVVVIAPCSYAIARSLAELPALAREPEWRALRAVRAGAVFVADGCRFFNRPGPRLVDSAEILAEILHPDRIGTARHGRDWIRFGEEPDARRQAP
jgi:iron complex transport system substrate-binding protein